MNPALNSSAQLSPTSNNDNSSTRGGDLAQTTRNNSHFSIDYLLSSSSHATTTTTTRHQSQTMRQQQLKKEGPITSITNAGAATQAPPSTTSLSTDQVNLFDQQTTAANQLMAAATEGMNQTQQPNFLQLLTYIQLHQQLQLLQQQEQQQQQQQQQQQRQREIVHQQQQQRQLQLHQQSQLQQQQHLRQQQQARQLSQHLQQQAPAALIQPLPPQASHLPPPLLSLPTQIPGGLIGQQQSLVPPAPLPAAIPQRPLAIMSQTAHQQQQQIGPSSSNHHRSHHHHHNHRHNNHHNNHYPQQQQQQHCRSSPPYHPPPPPPAIHRTKSLGGSDNMKPAHSYIGLIGMCILSVPEKRMVLNDIYHFIQDHYPYYRTRGSGWRNSVRHNLSLNECFQKNGRAANGKGHYWTIHPANMEDFMMGDFRRRRAQRKVRRWNNMEVPSDESDDESIEDATKPPLPEHFKRSLEMHRRLEENYRLQAQAASVAFANVVSAAAAAAVVANGAASGGGGVNNLHHQNNTTTSLSVGSPSPPPPPMEGSGSPLFRVRKEIP